MDIDIIKMLLSSRIIIFSGEYGRGKSLSSVALCYIISMLKNNKKIMSNIPLFFKDIEIEHLFSTSQYDKSLSKIVINHDEMQRDFNCREFLSNGSTLISKFSIDFRKSDINLIGTSQYIDRLDLSLSEIVEVIIIPNFINTYSKNKDEDSKIRYSKKDYMVKWMIKDKIKNERYELKLNLLPYIDMYDTNFKPYPIVINHKEYLEHKEGTISKNRYELLMKKINAHIRANINNFSGE